MSIFSRIASAIFGAPEKTTPPVAGRVESAPAATKAVMKPVSKAITVAEVEGMIERIAAAQPGKYNWRESIVDLMKLLKLDNSLAARKELAKELGYTGPLDGSAEMNIWLHKQVMQQLAASGGQVPENLKT